MLVSFGETAKDLRGGLEEGLGFGVGHDRDILAGVPNQVIQHCPDAVDVMAGIARGLLIGHDVAPWFKLEKRAVFRPAIHGSKGCAAQLVRKIWPPPSGQTFICCKAKAPFVK
jgi:hypothetical protein